MRKLLFVLSLIAVPLASGTFQPSQDADYWRDTKTDLAYARQFVNDDVCGATAELFASCLKALDQAAYLLDSKEFDQLKSAKAGTSVDFGRWLNRVEELASAQNRYPKEMIFGAMINEQLGMFDNHAVLVPADKLNASFGKPLSDAVGIGIEEEINGAGVFIRRVYPNTPADSAGLLPNDRIVAVNGRPVPGGIKAIGALKGMAGAPGKQIRLTLQRLGGQEFTVELALANLTLRNVIFETLPVGKQVIGIATVRNFAHGVCEQLTQQLSFAGSKISALILDLRGNQGGALIEAACVMSLFSGEQKLVEKRPVGRLIPPQLPLVMDFSAEDQENWRQGLHPAQYPKLPLIVLINAASASASEMLAAALQDQQRAWLVGEVTFGKGSTQAVVGEPSRAKLRLIYTVSRYYRPSGGPLQLIGVTPNFSVPARAAATMAERTFPREGELYGQLLKREDSTAWSETRAADVWKLDVCVRQGGYTRWFSDLLMRKNSYEDHQLAYALAVLHCSK